MEEMYRMITVPPRNIIILLVVIFFGLMIIPLFADKYIVKLTLRIIVFAIFAMSLDFLIGYTGLVSFGHAAFFGLGAYVTQLMSPEHEAANLLICLPATLFVSALAAAVIGALSVRTKGVYFIMVTLAFAQMLFYFFFNWEGAGGSDGAFIFYKPNIIISNIIHF